MQRFLAPRSQAEAASENLQKELHTALQEQQQRKKEKQRLPKDKRFWLTTSTPINYQAMGENSSSVIVAVIVAVTVTLVVALLSVSVCVARS